MCFLTFDMCVFMFTATTVFNLDMFDDPEQDETLNPVETPETKNTDPPDSGRSTESNLSLVSSTTTGNTEQGVEEKNQ